MKSRHRFLAHAVLFTFAATASLRADDTTGVGPCDVTVGPITDPPIAQIDQLDTALTQDWYGSMGKCVMSPAENAKELDAYKSGLETKASLNVSSLGKMPVPDDLKTFRDNLRKLQPLLDAAHAIEPSKWVQNIQTDPGFGVLDQSGNMLKIFSDPKFRTENQDANFVAAYKAGTPFQKSVDAILTQVQNPDVRDAINYFHAQDLHIATAAGLASAYKLARQLGPGPDPSLLNSLQEPAPAMSKTSDPFTYAYGGLVRSDIEDFLVNHPLDPSQPNAANLNLLQQPAPNAFDNYVVNAFPNSSNTGEPLTLMSFGKVYTVRADRAAAYERAISGVARTLWGEARGCEATGREQFEAVGNVISTRSVAVIKAQAQEQQLDAQKQQAADDDIRIFYEQNTAENFVQVGQQTYRGVADLGIQGSTEPASEQVVKRPLQFSVWNGFTTETKSLSDFGALTSSQPPKGITDIPVSIRVPRPLNDTMALIYVLCPQIPSNQLKQGASQQGLGWRTSTSSSGALWKKAVDLATLAVLDPARYRSIYQFNTKVPITFYTHAVDLTFPVDEQNVTQMTFTDPETGKPSVLPLRGNGNGGSCDQFRLFSTKPDVNYGL